MNIYKKHYNKDIGYNASITRKRKILELLGNIEGKKILDVGCASGYLGEEIKKAGAGETVGIDISDVQIKKAGEVFDKVFTIDIQKEAMPFADNYFDAILLAEVIEHLFCPEKAIEEIKRVLKRDGEIIITTPNFLVFSNRIKMLFGKFRYTDTGLFDRGHVHFFSRESLFEFVKNSGLAIAGENNIIHPKVPKFIGKIFPNLFAFQLIIKIKNK